MNKALVINPTIRHKNGLGAYLNVWLADRLYVRAAVIDPDGQDRTTGFNTGLHGRDRASVFYEFGATPHFDSRKGELTGRYLVGSWYYHGPHEVFLDTKDGKRRRCRTDGTGLYVGFEQLVWKENDHLVDEQGLSVFGRYGVAHEDVSLIEHFWSCGGQYAGLLPRRDRDVLGFGMSQAILSDEYCKQLGRRANRETVYELYYSCRLTDWLIVSSGFQHITNAGGKKDDPHTMVAGLRVRIIY